MRFCPKDRGDAVGGFRQRWAAPGGYREVLEIGLPLVFSMASLTLMQFTDRVFLANHSVEAIAAAVPAGIASFMVLAFFMGTGNFTTVLVAQYTGAGRPDRVAASVWAGIWFALFSGAALWAISLAASPLFQLAGHAPAVRRMETAYFSILISCGGLWILALALSSFYSGRGRTRAVMLVNLSAAALNIPLDYALVFGAWGFPEMGIHGAALATVAAWAVMSGLFALLVFRGRNQELYGVRSNWRLDPKVFARLMRFGLPGGVEFFVDIASFTVFVFLVGRLGTAELAASNIAFSMHSIAFLPAVGMHIAVSSLAGQAMGARSPARAVYATHSTMHLTLVYVGLASLALVLFPDPLLNLFRPDDAGADFARIRDTGVVLMRFVAVFCMFDAVGLIVIGALKGAGDTAFVMRLIVGAAVVCFMLPTWVAYRLAGAGIYGLWSVATAYMALLAAASAWRFASGAWTAISVIHD
jgi:MATE family multidrug resistance protein